MNRKQSKGFSDLPPNELRLYLVEELNRRKMPYVVRKLVDECFCGAWSNWVNKEV